MAQQPRESTFCSWRGLECASQPPIGQLTITWNPSLGGSDTSGLLGGSGTYTHTTKIIKFQEKKWSFFSLIKTGHVILIEFLSS